MSDAETAVLELLANGPSSFAALYSYLLRNNLVPHDVSAAYDRLLDMEQRGFVTVRATDDLGRLGNATPSFRRSARAEYVDWLGRLDAAQLQPQAVSLDEVGLWFAPGPKGEEIIASWVREATPDEMWELEATPDSVTIRAPTETAAMRVLTNWLLRHPDRIADEASRTDKPLKDYRLRSGRVLRHGLEVRFTLRDVASR